MLTLLPPSLLLMYGDVIVVLHTIVRWNNQEGDENQENQHLNYYSVPTCLIPN